MNEDNREFTPPPKHAPGTSNKAAMIKMNHKFQVSADELKYLKKLASHDESIARLLRFEEIQHDRSSAIHLDRDEAERLRGYLTELLSAVGFDTNYSPNEQGQMLERLIDRFYLR